MFISATPQSEKSLETVRLVLSMAANEAEYPQELKAYFLKVVKDALELIANPAENAMRVEREAISLAVLLTGSDESIMDAMKNIVKSDELDPGAAKTALNRMGSHFESANKFTNISPEILSAI